MHTFKPERERGKKRSEYNIFALEEKVRHYRRSKQLRSMENRAIKDSAAAVVQCLFRERERERDAASLTEWQTACFRWASFQPSREARTERERERERELEISGWPSSFSVDV